MPGTLKKNNLKITLHNANPLVKISGQILGLFLDDSEKIDMDSPVRPTCCDKTKAIFSCPCAFYNWGCKKDIEPCLQMTESFISKDPSEIPGAEIQRFSKETNTYAMIILKQSQHPELKLDEIKESGEDGVSVESISSPINDTLLCINDVPALFGPFQKVKDISYELDKLDILNPVARRTYLKCFPDLLKDYAISEQPGVVASCGSINAVAPGGDGIRDSLLHANEGAQI